MRWTRRRRRRTALRRTAKSCGSDAPTLASSSGDASFSRGDGGKKARSPGRARRKPLKPLRREGRTDPPTPVVTTVCFLPLHTGRGCERAPGLPCALLFSGRMNLPAKLGRIARRENADAWTNCSLTIESEESERRSSRAFQTAARMGGATPSAEAHERRRKRYPSIAVCEDDGFREGLNPSYTACRGRFLALPHEPGVTLGRNLDRPCSTVVASRQHGGGLSPWVTSGGVSLDLSPHFGRPGTRNIQDPSPSLRAGLPAPAPWIP